MEAQERNGSRPPAEGHTFDFPFRKHRPLRPMFRPLSRSLLMLPLALATASPHVSAEIAARERVRLDAGWRFHLGDAHDAAATAAFDDTAWRTVDVPHDWSIELQPRPDETSECGGGFFPTGTGWYRRTIEVPASWAGRSVVLEFEGVYRDAEVFVDGVRLGIHPYGYTPFSYDVTPHVTPGRRSTIAVRVDNSAQPNSRWYSGSGIYRHVWLEARPHVHLPRTGLFIRTSSITSENAELRWEAIARNTLPRAARGTLNVSILAPDGTEVATVSQTLDIAAGSDRFATGTLEVAQPQTWDPDSPNLYRARARLALDDATVDEIVTNFGIRTVRVSAERGFELNGRSIELIGGNVHHDNGPLGAASFDRAEERKVRLLKDAGFNAVRTAHNPPSTAFLDACDRLGMLVMDEAFDGWARRKLARDYADHFHAHALDDLSAMVLRDRNHPSVVIWSVGNEMFERGNAEGRRIAAMLAARIRDLDASRPVTAGVNGLGSVEKWPELDPLFAVFDIAGYNYEMPNHAADHLRVPGRVVLGTESFLSDTFDYWAASVDHTHVIGDFVWTALDYLGESGIGRWTPPDVPATPHWEGKFFPWHGALCSDIDLTGRRRAVSHYRNIVWDRGEKLYASVRVPTEDGRPWNVDKWGLPPSLPSWTWPGHEGRPLVLDVYSRHEYVRVYLDERLVGEAPTTRAERFKARFEIPYAPGTLHVVGTTAGREESTRIETTDPATALRLTTESRPFAADGQDLVFVEVEIVDDRGRIRYDAAPLVHYEVSGPAVIAGIASADLTTTETYQANPRKAYDGRALVVLRTQRNAGTVTLHARADGLAPASISVTTK
jgi:beta-galactosidase